MVFDAGAGGAAPITDTSSSLKSIRCRSGSVDGVLVQGVSKNRRAVDTLCVVGIVNVPLNCAHWPFVAVTLTRLV